MQRQTPHGRYIDDLGQLRRQPLRRRLRRHLGLRRPLHPLTSSGLTGRRKVLLLFLHLPTTFSVTVSLRRTITPTTIGMLV